MPRPCQTGPVQQESPAFNTRASRSHLYETLWCGQHPNRPDPDRARRRTHEREEFSENALYSQCHPPLVLHYSGLAPLGVFH